MKTKYIVLAVVLTIAVGLFVVGCPKPPVDPNGNGGQPPVQGPTVRVAANLPISGDLAVWGASIRDGGNMAIEELKAAEPAGPTINVDWQDNAGDPPTAVTIMQKQFLQPPDIYVSGIKPQVMAIMDQVAAKGTPNFVWILDRVINQETSNNLRSLVSYKIEPPIYLDYAKRIGAKRVAIAYVLLPHSKDEFDTLIIPGLKEQGINDILVEEFDFGNTDFKPIATKVKQFAPDLIILNGFQGDLVSLVRALRTQGAIKDGNTIGTYDMIDAGTVLGADEMEGIRVVAPLFQSRPETRADWTQRFKEKFAKDPLYIHAFAYDMIQVINDAAKRVPASPSATDWITAIKATDIEGVTGPLKFDADGDLMTPLEVGVYRNGQLVPDTGQSAEDAVDDAA